MIGLLANWKVTAVSSALALIVGFGAGWSVKDAFADREALRVENAHKAALLSASQAAMRRNKIAGEITSDIGQKSAERQVIIRTQTQEVIREVPRFITVEAEKQSCPSGVPWGFVRLHDAAASGSGAPAVPDASTPPNDAPSGVTTAAVASTVTGNYGTCHAEAERLRSLQEWIKAQATAWNKE